MTLRLILSVAVALLVGATVVAAGTAPTPRATAGAGGDSVLGGFTFTNTKEPVAITSDTLEFAYRDRLLVYRGNVVAIQGETSLRSDLLTVKLDEQDDNRVKTVIAEGHVRLTKLDREATADRAELDQTARTVVLSGGAVLHDGPNHVSGDRVIVYLDEQRSEVTGGQGRVSAVLYPPTHAATTPAAPTPTARRPKPR